MPHNGSTVPLVDVFVIDRSFVAFDAGEHSSCALWQQTRADMTCNNAASKAPALNGECWGDGSYGQNSLPSRRVGHQLKDICRILQVPPMPKCVRARRRRQGDVYVWGVFSFGVFILRRGNVTLPPASPSRSPSSSSFNYPVACALGKGVMGWICSRPSRAKSEGGNQRKEGWVI